MSPVDLARYDPFSPEVLHDPYPWYAALRASAPCHFVRSRGLWVVSRYDDVSACVKDHAVYSSTGGVGSHWEQRPMMPMYDPPQHTRMRRLVSRAFQPGAIAALQATIETAAVRLVDAFVEQGHADLVEDIAVPLSIGVIADLIGMPPERRGDLRRWSKGIVEELAGGLPREQRASVDALRKEFVEYLRGLVEERKSDTGRRDVIATLCAAHDADRLSERETVAFCVLLLTAGYETTVNAIANGALAFARFPEAWQRLCDHPEDRTLLRGAVEETVRYDGAVQSFFRNTLQPVELHGVKIPRGSKVMMLFASANRDGLHFDAPDAFRIDRPEQDHLGYGAGIHYCLGAPLARAQLTAVWGALARRAPGFEIVDGAVERTHSILFRGARRLPIRVTNHPRSAAKVPS